MVSLRESCGLKARGVAYGMRELVIPGLVALEEKTLERARKAPLGGFVGAAGVI
jgi:hypothetical protein